MNHEFNNEFQNKRILVTGGTGSIGSVVVEELLKYNPRQIRVFSRDESKQFELTHRLGESSRINYLIGDIRDKERLDLAMENIDIVFHAAALKHVVACEKNPFEAVKTNVSGTQNVIDCAFANKVDKVVGISTDKATDPTNVMGCTKLLAEKIMLSTYFYKGDKKTKFCYVRFGNVLASRGSVVPLFINQIRQGGPVTVTDPDMTRFFMATSDAVNLVLKSAVLMKDREIFIFKMPVVTIGDLAQAVIKLMQERNKDIPQNIDVKVIGKRDGERKYEKLLTQEESANALGTEDMFIIVPDVKINSPLSELPVYANAKKIVTGDYSSNNQNKLSIEEIKQMLAKAGI